MRHFVLRIGVGCWAITGLVSGLSAQSSHPVFFHFSVEEGLPSSEVYEILEDRHGFIWFGTDNGVCRFDGLNFVTFATPEGLADPVVFQILEDHRGWLWLRTMSGRIYVLKDNQIQPFWGNAILETHREQFMELLDMAVDTDGSVVISSWGAGIFQFCPDHTFDQIEHPGVFLYPLAGKWLMASSIEKSLNFYDPFLRGKPFFSWYRDEEWVQVDLPGWNSSQKWVSTDSVSPENTIVHFYGNTCLIENGQLDCCSQQLPPISVEVCGKDNLLIGYPYQKGARHYSSVADFPDRPGRQILPDYSISHILCDKDGGFWFATLEDGVFYCPDPAIEVYDKKGGLPAENFTKVIQDSQGNWWAGAMEGWLYSSDSDGKTIEMDSLPDNITYDLFYDEQYQTLWWGNRGALLWKKEGRTGTVTWSDSTEILKSVKGIRLAPNGRSLWVFGHWGLGKINRYSRKMEEIFLLSKTQSVQIPRILDLLPLKDGRVLVASSVGLLEYRGQILHHLSTGHRATLERINTLAELSDGSIAIGTNGAGLFIWDGRQVKSILVKDGLATGKIDHLFVGADGCLFAGSKNGLHKICWPEGQLHIQVMDASNGLPSDEITWVSRANPGRIWVATRKGLANIEASWELRQAKEPRIEAVFIDGRPVGIRPGRIFRTSEKNLVIRYAAIRFPNAEEVQYQYRLNPNSAWVNTISRQVELVSPTPGNYRFEVQAKTNGHAWSASGIYEFEVKGPLFLSWWALTSYGALSLGAFFVVFRLRTQAIKKRAALNKRLWDLERKALQLQINPHFVANCLTAIQKNILTNDQEQAFTILSLFSGLIRRVFNASGREGVSLEQEYQMLEEYLSLHQVLRKNSFQFEMAAEDGLFFQGYVIPPMLIQPFVENAIEHGASARGNQGKVWVHFSQENDQVKIVVGDNGKGFEPAKETHRPSGTQVTLSRLKLLAEKNDDFLPAEVQVNRDSYGLISGSEVIIRLQKRKNEPSRK